MYKLFPLLIILTQLTSCMGFGYHRGGPGGIFGLAFFILLVAAIVVALNRSDRFRGERSGRRTILILLAIAGALFLLPFIGLILIPVFFMSLGVFLFFPPVIILLLILILLLAGRRRR